MFAMPIPAFSDLGKAANDVSYYFTSHWQCDKAGSELALTLL